MSSGKKEMTIEELYVAKINPANDFVKAVIDQLDQLEAESKDKDEFHSCGICQDFLDGNLLSLLYTERFISMFSVIEHIYTKLYEMNRAFEEQHPRLFAKIPKWTVRSCGMNITYVSAFECDVIYSPETY